jgi:ribose 5-phosphate isomerase A
VTAPDPGTDIERDKRSAAMFAATLVEDGMAVGLGTGSTVDLFLRPLAERGLRLRCVATSVRTETRARELGLEVEGFDGPDGVDRLDVAIDGADQVDDEGWLVKGGGAAHTREKRVAAAADRFIVIVDPGKLVPRVEPPVPLELLAYGMNATLRELGDVTLRDVPRSPDGGVIADFTGSFTDTGALARRLSETPGVIEHGLFPPSMVSEIVIGRGSEVERRRV